MWPSLVEYEAVHLLPAQQMNVYSAKTYPDKWWVKLGKWKASSGIHKAPSLRAKNLLAAMQPNLISALGQRINKGVVSVVKNECFLCITGQQGAFRPGREKGNELILQITAGSSSPLIVSLRVLSLPPSTSSAGAVYKQTRDPTMEKFCSLLLPNVSPSSAHTHNCPSFLSPDTQLRQLPVSAIVNWTSGQQNNFSSRGGNFVLFIKSGLWSLFTFVHLGSACSTSQNECIS